MSETKDGSTSVMQHRINAEIQDNLDEDLELELEDSELADLLAEGHELPEKGAFPRAPSPHTSGARSRRRRRRGSRRAGGSWSWLGQSCITEALDES